VTVLHSIVAYLIPGAIALVCVAIAQVVLVATGCLLGKTLNYFHIVEAKATADSQIPL
jgi:hypothetical protein